MKTKTIPFDLETAKKIQAGEIEGKILYDGHEVIILDYNAKKHPSSPIRFVYLDKDEVDYMGYGGLYIKVPDDEPRLKVGDTVSINLINSFYDADFRARYHSKLAKVLSIYTNGAGIKIIITGEEIYFPLDELTFVQRDAKDQQFKKGDRVLVRDYDGDKWEAHLFSHEERDMKYPYCVRGGILFMQCIPYEGNEHLLGTTDNPKVD